MRAARSPFAARPWPRRHLLVFFALAAAGGWLVTAGMMLFLSTRLVDPDPVIGSEFPHLYHASGPLAGMLVGWLYRDELRKAGFKSRLGFSFAFAILVTGLSTPPVVFGLVLETDGLVSALLGSLSSALLAMFFAVPFLWFSLPAAYFLLTLLRRFAPPAPPSMLEVRRRIRDRRLAKRRAAPQSPPAP